MVQGKATKGRSGLAARRAKASPYASAAQKKRAKQRSRKAAPKKAKLKGNLVLARKERQTTSAIVNNIEEIMAARHVHAGGHLRVLKKPKSEKVDVESAPRHARHRGPTVKNVTSHGGTSLLAKRERKATKREEMLKKLLGDDSK